VETIAGELAALCLFLRYEDRPGRWVIPFWLIMAITSLMKGLLGFVLPILIVGVYSTMADGLAEFRQRILRGSLAARISWLTERNRWFFNWYTLAGITIAVAIYYVPFAISHAETGSSKGLYMVYRENVERYFEPFDHRGPIYLYFYVVFALMAPWSAFLPAALVHAHQRRRETNDHARADRFTLTFFWATFVFFTLSGSRRSYYILPILPAAAILVARLLEAPRETLSGWSKRLLNVGFVAVAAAVALLALALMPPRSILPPPYSLLPVPPHRIILAVGWIGCVGALVYAFRSLDSRRILVSTAVVAYLFMFYFFVFAMPAADQWRGERAFALQVKSVIGSHPEKLVFFRNVGPVYYLNLDRPVPEYQRAPTLAGAIAKGQFRWVVARRRDMNFLKIPAKVAASEAVFPWDSADHRLNAMVLLEVQPPGPFG
jgi:4-amino-4-deoxy-L-arabinose transferase-like glycosyltransferase